MNILDSDDKIPHALFPTLIEVRQHPKSIEILNYLSEKLTSERLNHVLSVQETAIELARIHQADVWKTNLAALLHDVVKWMDDDQLYATAVQNKIELDPIEKIMPALLHAIVGVKYAINLFNVTDLDVLEAIRNHTTGNSTMGETAKLLYVADFSEPTREYIEAESVREIAKQDLDQAVHDVARYKLEYLLKKGWIIHPNTLRTYNHTLVQSLPK
ncbi:bis(5'-nucleosyl)-tetraphosphatase (symmetrical) YqeK [Candidatus Poribacteria bacterium]|nr:bis(5'-nucleosyl)-tetraphosphatase (symmetrical) YqeK [Candidatus Poribacteria bacterium]